MNRAASAAIAIGDRPGEVAVPASANRFYIGMSAASLGIVLAGFAPSFYLRPATQPALSPIVVVHGIVFSSWFVLFAVQTALVAAGYRGWHRQLGVGGAILAVLMVALGPAVAIPAARRGSLPGDPLAFLLVMLGDLFLFTVFVGAAIYYRRRSEAHKRLMVLGTISLLPPAINRLPFASGRPAVIAAIMLALLAAAPLHDLMIKRRVHRLSAWCGLAVMLSFPLRFAIAQTDLWHRVARWLIGN